jgi:hypothetical protein
MVTAIPKRTFLAGQEFTESGKTKDIIAHKGQKMEFTERDAIKYWGALQFNEKDEKRLLAMSKAKNSGLRRSV